MSFQHPSMTWEWSARRLLDDVMGVLWEQECHDKDVSEFWLVETIEKYACERNRSRVVRGDVAAIVHAAIDSFTKGAPR